MAKSYLSAEVPERFVDDQEIRRFRILLRDGLWARYRNGETWEAPHPLLLRTLRPNDYHQLVRAPGVSREASR